MHNMWHNFRNNWTYHFRQIKIINMEKIIQWHNEAIYGEPHHNALNLEMARELGKMTAITYDEYSKMCRRMGINPMRDETFIIKYGKL